MEIFVARQPILNKHEKLYAYELLFRNGTANYMPDVDGDSAHFSRFTKISSVRDAATYIGLDELKSFITVINLSKLGKEKPGELSRTSCTRAKFCESIGGISESPVNVHELFTLGILSLIDAILDQPMESIIGKLPLNRNLSDALVHGKGGIVNYLNLAVAYEKGDWEAVSLFASSLALDEKKIPFQYIAACKWAGAITAL